MEKYLGSTGTGSNSTSPVPSLSSGYLSIYSQDHDIVPGVTGRRHPLVRHPSLPGDEEWEEVWQLSDDNTVTSARSRYSDPDREYYSSMAELDLDIPWRPRHPPHLHRVEPHDLYIPPHRRVRNAYVQTINNSREPVQLSGVSTWQRYHKN